MSKKQSTLFRFGFKKKVEHRGKIVEIKEKEFTDDIRGIYKCSNCEKRFKSKAGLVMHDAWCKDKEQGNNNGDNNIITESSFQEKKR